MIVEFQEAGVSTPLVPLRAAEASAGRKRLDRAKTLIADERIAFVIMGVFNTGFAFAVFAALLARFGNDHYMVLLLVTHVVGVLEAFMMYRLRVFRVRGNLLLDLARFESVNLTALAINAAILPVLVEVVGLPVLVGQVVVLGLVTTGTFLAHKHFSFRRPKVLP